MAIIGYSHMESCPRTAERQQYPFRKSSGQPSTWRNTVRNNKRGAGIQDAKKPIPSRERAFGVCAIRPPLLRCPEILADAARGSGAGVFEGLWPRFGGCA